MRRKKGSPLRLYSGQVQVVATELLELLNEGEDLEVTPENLPEVQKDIESVLREYIRLNREMMDEARDKVAQNRRSNIGREKRKIAKQKGIDIFDDPVGYIINQLIETFFHSHFVDEVYSLDRQIRRKLNPVLKRHMSVEEELDEEVRDKIKNLEEGSQAWDIEYQKAMGKLKRTKNLE